jgi:hypothetical protein
MKILRSSLVVLLSLMVFLTSSGLTVNLHYCAGKLANVSLKDNHANCMMPVSKAKNSCEKSNSKSSISKKDACCKNQQVKAKTDNKIFETKSKEKVGINSSFNFVQSYFTSLFSFHTEEVEEETKQESFSLFPLLKDGLYILLQNFRN